MAGDFYISSVIRDKKIVFKKESKGSRKQTCDKKNTSIPVKKLIPIPLFVLENFTSNSSGIIIKIKHKTILLIL